ncbi:unnamed protein product [Dicrocoelium dendriticum]|nr:unnamed protein product [Dicrocoelium dendriticum]
MRTGGKCPKLYERIYGLHPDEPYVSPYLSKQSVVSDPANGTRISVVSTRYTGRFSKVRTVHDIFESGLKCSLNRPCLGSRKSTALPYDWLTYNEVNQLICAFGSALVHIAGYRAGKHNFVGIYARNSPEWIVTQQACAAYSYVYVPLYDTLGKDAIQHILTQTKLQTVMCYSMKEANFILNEVQSSIKYVILATPRGKADCSSATTGNVRIIEFDEFIRLGKANPVPKQLPNPSAVCSLCYTSGSTGIPKGAVLAHEKVTNAVLNVINGTAGKFAEQATVHLCYLPLAHILEQIITNIVLISGACEAFLTGGPETLLADLREVRPTVFGAVPRVLCRFAGEYYKKIPKATCFKKMLESCIRKKNAEQARGKFNHASVADKLLFKKFRQALGGRVCAVISGGAPLPSEISRFMRAALNCPVIEGYGSTETCGAVSLTFLGEPDTNTTGGIIPGIEVRLADVPDMGIVASRDNVGEICVRGLRCTEGYYKDPVSTAQLLDEEGWLHTGDVGKWTSVGALKVVDRCKNMFKLTQGEYIAAEKVEGIYQCCSLVQFALLDGDSSRTFAVVIVYPDFVALRSELTKAGVLASSNASSNGASVSSRSSDEELCSALEVRKFVLIKLNTLGRERGLKGFEMAKSIHLTSQAFTIDNGLLTPTLKIARYRAREQFRQTIKNLYTEGELVT